MLFAGARCRTWPIEDALPATEAPLIAGTLRAPWRCPRWAGCPKRATGKRPACSRCNQGSRPCRFELADRLGERVRSRRRRPKERRRHRTIRDRLSAPYGPHRSSRKRPARCGFDDGDLTGAEQTVGSSPTADTRGIFGCARRHFDESRVRCHRDEIGRAAWSEGALTGCLLRSWQLRSVGAAEVRPACAVRFRAAVAAPFDGRSSAPLPGVHASIPPVLRCGAATGGALCPYMTTGGSPPHAAYRFGLRRTLLRLRVGYPVLGRAPRRWTRRRRCRRPHNENRRSIPRSSRV
jgi:hypothetical protein